MHAGFHAALELRRTCRSLYRLLSLSIGWMDYLEYTPDLIEHQVDIHSHLSCFDRLLLGQWKEDLFFEQLTFDPDFDHFGGIRFTIEPSFKITAHSFAHRETLPCYIRDVVEQQMAGKLPPVIPAPPEDATPSQRIGGLRIKHSCSECKEHDDKLVLKEWKLKPQPYPQSWVKTFSLDTKRHIHFQIHHSSDNPYKNTLPYCVTNYISVNQMPLTGFKHEFFTMVVMNKKRSE